MKLHKYKYIGAHPVFFISKHIRRCILQFLYKVTAIVWLFMAEINQKQN